ncbi:MAG: WecB/TagA/CpsF family glycosyltransferase [Muribaculaceae bacterium]|nr:WecB/TagA/CpsF family glycosyltransferase [Muribaculaceae bacterium]
MRNEQVKQVMLNGVGIYPFESENELIDFALNRKCILVAINAEKILHATDQTCEIINRNVGYSDGAGAVKALRQRGYANAVKIAGCELWLKIIERLAPQGKSFYLVGGKQEVIDETVAKLREQFPTINIAGYRNGYIKSDDERLALIDDIASKRPDVVFVAMGSPKQELLMEEIQEHHQALFQGLGGSFDVYTGHVNRAPEWWVRHNLEFAYRLIKEPKRIKRQIHLVTFAWWLLTGKFKREK